jgi:type I restriction enzyme, S subunit
MARSGIYPPSVQPGKPRLGAIPEGWTTYRFADLFDVIERPAKLLDDTEYQLITARRSRGGVVARERLLGRDILTKTQFYVEEDDFVISNRQIIHGGCGIVPAALDGAVVSNEYTVLRPKSVLLLDYLRYLPHTTFLQQTFFHASVGVDVEKMVFDLDQWLGFKVHLPPIREQRDIAEILTSVDEAIAASHAVIDQTGAIKRELLSRLLTRGIGHRTFKPTEIGQIPENWEVMKIEEIGDVRSGRQRSPHFTEGSPRPYLRVANVFDGYIDGSDVFCMNFTDREYKRFKLIPGDILLNEGQSLELVGRNAVYAGYPADCCFQNTLVLFRAGSSVKSEFAYAVMQNLFMQGRFMEIATRTTSVAHLGANRFGGLRVGVPPLDEQEKIAKIHADVIASMAVAEKNLGILTCTKSALMLGLLTGRVRVAS